MSDREVSQFGKDINLTAYNDAYFLALAQSEDLVFFALREIRKLIFGKVLFERDACASRAISALRTCRVSKVRLRQLYSALKDARRSKSSLTFDLNFSRSLETLYFLTMHSRMEILYSKHKYLLIDAKQLPSPSLANLLERVGALYGGREELLNLCSEFGECLASGFPEIAKSVGKFVGDAKTLLANGFEVDAIFPLRYAALRTVSLVSESDLPLKMSIQAPRELEWQLSGLVSQLLLLGRAVPSEVSVAFDVCIAELEIVCSLGA
ncbi:hypothetical protein [Bradyrhizobium sp. SZCCHNRI2014]|uniref:hypothetical protein n=1 Tax=Bradyrhizobium sp. SZCCHNRI2014 TaxID=3057285 RepID=UPI00291637F6|nr:hypothetical protein [Bradyrhizobium sp. SZCCHNRI2014]